MESSNNVSIISGGKIGVGGHSSAELRVVQPSKLLIDSHSAWSMGTTSPTAKLQVNKQADAIPASYILDKFFLRTRTVETNPIAVSQFMAAVFNIEAKLAAKMAMQVAIQLRNKYHALARPDLYT